MKNIVSCLRSQFRPVICTKSLQMNAKQVVDERCEGINKKITKDIVDISATRGREGYYNHNNKDGSSFNFNRLLLSSVAGYIAYKCFDESVKMDEGNNKSMQEVDGIMPTQGDYDQFVKSVSNVQELVEKVKGKDVIIFLGHSRSGKSTLINQLIGYESEAVEDEKTCKVLLKTYKDNNGPKIDSDYQVRLGVVPVTAWGNNKPESKFSGNTAFDDLYAPVDRFLKRVQGVHNSYTKPLLQNQDVMVDVPGFGLGKEQDVANTFYIRQVIKNAKTVRVVLVADINDIYSDNVRQFNRLMHKVSEIMPNIFDSKDTDAKGNSKLGVSIVFSKVGGRGIVSTDQIRNLLEHKIEKQILRDSKYEVQRKLVAHFARSKQDGVVSIFPRPLVVGTARDAFDVANAINAMEKMVCKKDDLVDDRCKIGVSTKSKEYLRTVKDLLEKQKVENKNDDSKVTAETFAEREMLEFINFVLEQGKSATEKANGEKGA